jgi:hypothetical protein
MSGQRLVRADGLRARQLPNEISANLAGATARSASAASACLERDQPTV